LRCSSYLFWPSYKLSSSVSPVTKYFSMESVLPIMCPKYFSLLIVVVVFSECFDWFY
jgi:hypothetical protein